MYVCANSLDATIYTPTVGWPSPVFQTYRLAAAVIEEVMRKPTTLDQLPACSTYFSESAPVSTPQLGDTSTESAPVGSSIALRSGAVSSGGG